MIELILPIVAILGGIGGLLTAYLHALYVKRWKDRKSSPVSCPHVTVIAPHKGKIIRENIKDLISQDYKGIWEIIFVTTREDSSYNQLLYYTQKYNNLRIIVAEDVVQLARHRGIYRGQKNHNFVTALSALSAQTEVIAFIDADVCPSRDWLRTLVEPFSKPDAELGATTLARLYTPGPGLASHLQAVWVLGSAAFLVGPWGYIWGGSFAIPKAVLENTDVLDRWKGLKGSISSDDLNLSLALRQHGYRTCYVPGCKALRKPPQKRETLSDVLRFTNRQLLHVCWTRKDLWLATFMTHGMESLALLGSLCIVWLQPIALLALIAPVLNIIGFFLLNRSVQSVAKSDRKLYRSLQKAILLVGVLMPILATINAIVAVFRVRMVWGGIEYTRRAVIGYTKG